MSNEPVVLAIDDEPGLLRLIKLELTSKGFRVITADSAESGERIVDELRPDIILLDILMPGKTGMEFLEDHIKKSDIPVIFVTARDRSVDEVRGLEKGADDYVTKPFDVDVLAARIRAVLRRGRSTATFRPIVIGDLEIDLELRRLQKAGVEVKLTRTEWLLLKMFAESPGRVLRNSELLTKVWGPEYRDDLQYLRVWVSRLRFKMEPDPKNPTIIVNIPQIGYRMEVAKTEDVPVT